MPIVLFYRCKYENASRLRGDVQRNRIGMGLLCPGQETKNFGVQYCTGVFSSQQTSGVPLRHESLVQVSSVEIFVVSVLLDQSDSEMQANPF